MLNSKYIKNVRNRVVHFLKVRSHKPLHLLTNDQSHEIAKLLGYWILEKYPNTKATVIKGRVSTECLHFVLIIEDDGCFWIFDPSIWVMFKHKRNILVSHADSLHGAIKIVDKIYGGRWHQADKLTRSHIKVHELILKKSISEHLK